MNKNKPEPNDPKPEVVVFEKPSDLKKMENLVMELNWIKLCRFKWQQILKLFMNKRSP